MQLSVVTQTITLCSSESSSQRMEKDQFWELSLLRANTGNETWEEYTLRVGKVVTLVFKCPTLEPDSLGSVLK